jgi:fused signal recognition particle receptor
MAKLGMIERLRGKLGKTRTALADGVRKVLGGGVKVDEGVFEQLEELLIEADVGVETSLAIVEDMRTAAREQKLEDGEALFEVLKEEISALLAPGSHTVSWESSDGPHVTLIAGVNGSGKTTTAGKLAAKLRDENKNVLLGAADTFRAAAAEQLCIWSERTGAAIVKHAEGADPAAVAYDATDAAAARGVDNLLIDTAGRLHTKVNLMEELKKVHRVVGKRLPGAPHEVLLVLDATTGQNALQQARQFTQALPVTGIVLTKLDGTAKGGVVIAIQKELDIPIKYIGVGEGVDDLQPFNAQDFVEALFS